MIPIDLVWNVIIVGWGSPASFNDPLTWVVNVLSFIDAQYNLRCNWTWAVGYLWAISLCGSLISNIWLERYRFQHGGWMAVQLHSSSSYIDTDLSVLGGDNHGSSMLLHVANICTRRYYHYLWYAISPTINNKLGGRPWTIVVIVLIVSGTHMFLMLRYWCGL